MNRIFLTTIGALLLALAASAGVSYWLALNPPFQIDPLKQTPALEEFAGRLFDKFHALPEEDWEPALEDIEGAQNYLIDWFEAAEYAETVEDYSTLNSQNQVLTTLNDGTPLLEFLIPNEEMVVEVVPFEGFDRRWILNRAVTVIAVLLIGLLASLVTLYPIAKRLRNLQRLAGAYSSGNLHARNTDTAADDIGKLGQSMDAMAARVASLLEEKEHLVDDQQELMRAVAHEFRAPMARMRFALDMHEESESFSDESKQEVDTALDELDGLVTEVLRYARLQRSAPQLQRSVVPLADVLTEAVTAVQALRPEVPVQVKLNTGDVRIEVDPVQFQRALRNLISNTLKYSKSRVEVNGELGATELFVHIDDDGPGIGIADRKRVLAPFVRLDSSRTRKLGGSGLGLAIVAGVMSKHGGRVDITDSESGGARFTLVLPYVCEALC